MFYSIWHLTRFHYKTPVSESLMELRMHPRTEGGQRCLSFQLSVDPRTRVYEYRDYLGNMVHHFDVPGQHRGRKKYFHRIGVATGLFFVAMTSVSAVS